MKQKAVHDYVKKKRGLYAAEGGEVPGDDDGYYDSEQKAWIPNQPKGEELAANAPASKGNPVDDIENGSEDDDAPDEAAAAVPEKPAAAPVDKEQAMKDYLAGKYKDASDDTGIKDAVAESKRQNLISNLGSAFEQMATSRAVANGMRPDDGSFWKGISAQGQQGISQAQDARKQKIDAFMRQNDLERQVVQDQMTKGTYESKQNAARIAAELSDPKNPKSIAKVQAFMKLHDGEVPAGFDSSGYSAADIPQLAKDLHGMSQLKTQEKDVNAKIAGNKEIAAGRNQAHAENMALIEQRKTEAADSRKDAGDSKIAQHQYDALAKDLDSQTATSRSGIGKANDKVNSADRLLAFAGVSPDEVDAAKKDPKAMAALSAKMDQMSPQKKAEMVQGLMAQISSGGGSLGQFEHLNAQTAGQTIANIEQYFTSHPEAANAGPMLVDNLMTLKNERDTSKAVIDDHAAKLRTKYPKAFAHPSTADDAKNMYEAWTGTGKAPPDVAPVPQGGPGMAIGAPAGTTAPSAIMHPQASAAEQWAKANPKDPRAKAILERLDQADRPSGGQ